MSQSDIPPRGIFNRANKNMTKYIWFEDPPIEKIIFSSTKLAWLWLVIRFYVGFVWLEAGWAKLHSPAWTGEASGKALSGFIKGALAKTVGEHPDVQGWYAWFLKSVILPNAGSWSHAVAWGELLIGIALILGALVGIAAFFGLFMNFNFLLAGAVSVNPILAIFSLFLVLAWKAAGYYGLDRILLPVLGTPWQPGGVFKIKNRTQ